MFTEAQANQVQPAAHSAVHVIFLQHPPQPCAEHGGLSLNVKAEASIYILVVVEVAHHFLLVNLGQHLGVCSRWEMSHAR
jgi:hypothetical protein